MAATDPLSLAGQTAIVTGASSGIGAAVAIELARLGAAVAVNYRGDAEGADRTVRAIEALGGRAFTVRADVSREGEVAAMFEESEGRLGAADIVVSNAGLQKDGAVADLSLEDWNLVIGVNLTGGFLVGREAVRRFRRKGLREGVSRALGKLIFNSSVHERIPWAFHVNYAASKGGLSLLMQTMAQELASERIRVNAVAPGAIATAINAAERQAGTDEMMRLIPYGRIGDPEDVGRAVAWLATDASDYITGHTLFVDGGMALYPGFKGNG